ncbi:hepatoma-derived growth factor-related protein 3 isoform X2 [Siniperca chuatsi]|uniref:hepatoma-derived growth factor-related protein 3 isoform X2 n=1 Tax=Siniperca chuatsi TaxID=119488 RepID=UPI001CE20DDF|nr:hepatoma-derived growth factor-related protein 3 isoform X2 [Siniperca chuatsi]
MFLDTRKRCRDRRRWLPAHMTKKMFIDICQGEVIPMYYPLSFTAVEEPAFRATLPDPEDRINPVPVRVHPVQALKRPTQHHKTMHHSPHPPICNPSTSAFPAPDARMAHRINVLVCQHKRLKRCSLTFVRNPPSCQGSHLERMTWGRMGKMTTRRVAQREETPKAASSKIPPTVRTSCS